MLLLSYVCRGDFVKVISPPYLRIWQTAGMSLFLNKSVQQSLSSVRMALIILALHLGACSNALQWEPDQAASSGSSVNNSTAASSRSKAVTGPIPDKVVAVATDQLGTPYRYGGSKPGGFDCSGLVEYSYAKAGLIVPRTSFEQYRAAQPIDISDAKPGDLLFFRYDRKISHVGIYLGEDRFIHAPSTGKLVSVASLRDPHYQAHFVRAGKMY
jgi:murein DD-endopeptidase